MSRRDLFHRLIGVAMLAGSGATTLIHRALYDAARQGPPQFAEFALGLTTFLLASTGVLLIVHGRGLLSRRPPATGSIRAERREHGVALAGSPRKVPSSAGVSRR